MHKKMILPFLFIFLYGCSQGSTTSENSSQESSLQTEESSTESDEPYTNEEFIEIFDRELRGYIEEVYIYDLTNLIIDYTDGKANSSDLEAEVYNVRSYTSDFESEIESFTSNYGDLITEEQQGLFNKLDIYFDSAEKILDELEEDNYVVDYYNIDKYSMIISDATDEFEAFGYKYKDLSDN